MLESSNYETSREILEKFERSKILEVYFSRLDGRSLTVMQEDYKELYDVELRDIKRFLLGQHPQDIILANVLRFSN